MRYLAVLFASMLLILTACGSNDDNTSGTDDNTNGTEEQEENNEETKDTEDSKEEAEVSVEEQVASAVQSYSDVMEQFQSEHVDGTTVQGVESTEDVATYFLENAPVTEKFANDIASKVVEEIDGELTWKERDFTVIVDPNENKTYQVSEDNYLFNYTIAGDATENRGHYTYNVRNVDGGWLVNELGFGYLDGEFPDEEEESEE
ncbi:hypothetical protein [Tenuibacillus multivorans]|uniref:Uncharacterized protein n=1 Tax=Tenuibacillus multivorans TaxID=237069 RepID=A0A1G9YNW2_9BACI|nr:hypothetical protein [Tenuibacillus multivorans]GEL78466.1 hypothetical protein TMU01_27010 [Tenuibacillus multivorans]SDN10146.1 hypothetical protein SAMN05216498_1471 [Tenuibacillus multivorans]